MKKFQFDVNNENYRFQIDEYVIDQCEGEITLEKVYELLKEQKDIIENLAFESWILVNGSVRMPVNVDGAGGDNQSLRIDRDPGVPVDCADLRNSPAGYSYVRFVSLFSRSVDYGSVCNYHVRVRSIH